MHTVTQLAQLLAQKKVSSRELTEQYLARIKQKDSALNSFITITETQALQDADAADRMIAAGKAGPLTGIPLAHKDIFCIDGIKTTCGSKMLDNYVATYDATLVNLFKTAGMVSLGKTNMDEFAMGSSNESSFYGVVKNPWDLERVPGGSSGGSAAAVAAGFAPIATATDTGGSIRQPAAFCNLSGFKPTYGRVSRYGMIAFASSLDQAGLLAHSVADIALVMNTMAAFDEKDSTSLDEPVPDYTKTLNDSLKGITIGLPEEYFAYDLDKDVSDAIQSAIKVYESLGATMKPVKLPNTSLSVPAYYVIAPAECSSNLARYDGVRFGYRCDEPKSLLDLYTRSRTEGFGSEVKRRIMIGTYVLSAGYYDAFYVKAQKIRRLIRDDFAEAFKTVDVILSPTTPTTAFKIGEKSKDPISMYLSDIFTIAANLAGLPAISIPCGFAKQLPVGLHLVGKAFAEAKLLNIAHAYQAATDWHTKRPENF